MNITKPIALGIGNGSLAASVCWLLRQAGITYDPTSRAAWQETGNKLVAKIFMNRPQNLPTALHTNKVDCVIIGLDMLTEWSEIDDFVVIAKVQVSKTFRKQNSKVVAFVRDGSRYTYDKRNLSECNIGSEYPKITKSWLRLNGIMASITQSYGGTEGMVAAGVYDCGIGVTETGTSIAANYLRTIDVIMDAPVVLAVRPEDINDERLEQFAAILNGVHAAQNYVLLKMNAQKNQLPDIISLLPALKSPTVHQLNDANSVAVETVVEKDRLASLIIELKKEGASGIIWHTLDSVIP
ncbi:ATP phosphoribosyltransferase [Candidatus Falkowbacteria bacterium RIFCSPLOWO2_02_FULL_45_15]|uniref:ATP phosphoribosyltransferase n=2 Tax=Parcubacteria group TaxID=1794811 RepID=A0A1G1YN99_9BACT|nr:MAG: ATP phosphoribosyltransferase [Candidatus Falkowbacteria bacterium RIFCSPLOWO2_02_FULL_45_15]OGY53774.1 MAG: ATP phosphoribosyltransferase [Candidatus Buchananbacteria bacterium RIFCSPLOWO2_01_FULL_45_31]